jgi:hypothetical protein
MRKRYTFVLTIMPAEEDAARLQGRIRFIHNGKPAAFSGVDELQQLIFKTIQMESNVNLNEQHAGLPQSQTREGSSGLLQEPEV